MKKAAFYIIEFDFDFYCFFLQFAFIFLKISVSFSNYFPYFDKVVCDILFAIFQVYEKMRGVQIMLDKTTSV